jgi:hypothetical protein
VGGSYFWDCNLDLEVPWHHLLLEPQSIIPRKSLLNKSCCEPSQQSTCSGLELLDLSLTLNQGSGSLKQGLGCIDSLNYAKRQKIYKTKAVGQFCFTCADHAFWPIIWIWKDLGPMCFLSNCQSFANVY